MTRDDILTALRLTAMGRAGHPLQEQLADELAAVLSEPQEEPPEEPRAATVTVDIEPKKRGRPRKAE